ncbi:aldo/keto reductase [Sphingobacterium daejeonense]|uniref:aldo/keto reductase n=1 Tax=Sphingobacterium daejeonense TaxID=371142 RepID=UPI0010C28F34|nr:aldo/keto reductase [Sphingobacterium daejeonense]VTP95690.1 L-glyceraldehyde 3-phosphate reductase [Sphingobacterium daejeonense]
MGVDYVDIFYSHRFDPNTPLEETMMALDQIVRSGKALYVGISSYNSQRTKEAYDILKSLGTPFIIHQPSYSMLNRWVEPDGLLDTLDNLGLGSIVFSPLAQGMLTNKYLNKVPVDSRASQDKSLNKEFLSEENLKNIWSLNEIASSRGQTLAQMAISWVLKNKSVTSALIGASRSEQVVDCVGALKNLEFSEQELHQIDQYAKDAGINIWQQSAEL